MVFFSPLLSGITTCSGAVVQPDAPAGVYHMRTSQLPTVL